MASKAVIPQQIKGDGGVGGGKQKNVGGQGRNRKALNDIGNLATVRDVDAKPQRPVTRRFSAQLLANAPAVAAPDTKKAADGGAPNVTEKPKLTQKAEAAAKPAQKRITTKPKPEEVIEISPDTLELAKEKPSKNQPQNREKSDRKKVPTMTALLTARSKFACGLGDKPKEEPVVDIDAADAENELAVVEYVEDIYNFYKIAEQENRISDYMVAQFDINEKMRAILIDWLIDVHNKFELMPETLYLTVNIVDRFLWMKATPRRDLQLVGIAAMLIACKYEEIWAPEVNDFVCISDRVYNNEHILKMEKVILGKIEWTLTVPTHYVFLVRFIKASVPDEEVENLVYFLAELGLVHYAASVTYRPSVVAASAVYAARVTLNKSPVWTETLKLHTGFQEQQLIECAKLLVELHSKAAENKLQAVYRKYSKVEKCAVALHSAAKSLLAD